MDMAGIGSNALRKIPLNAQYQWTPTRWSSR